MKRQNIINRQRKRDFLKQKKTIRSLTSVLFGLILVFVHLLVFHAVSGQSLTFTRAAELVTFGQTIRPINPIKETAPLQQEDKKVKDISSSSFRLITPLGSGVSENISPAGQGTTTTSVATFSGTALYPNSEIFLDIYSNHFFSSTLSDNQRHWTWTNYGHPMDPGEHTLEAYSIAPNELAGKRDVLAQKYFFTVADDQKSSNHVSLGNSNFVEKGSNDNLGERISATGYRKSTYLFNIALLNKTDYGSGDEMNVELLFLPVIQAAKDQVDIEYSIYVIDSGGATQGEVLSNFTDQASLDSGGYFLKNIRLNESLMPGEYILKVMAKISQDDYYQSAKFNISPKPLITIGANTITVEKFGQAVVFNVILIMLILMIVVAIVIIEFKRFMVYRPIDEGDLQNSEYFTK